MDWTIHFSWTAGSTPLKGDPLDRSLSIFHLTHTHFKLTSNKDSTAGNSTSDTVLKMTSTEVLPPPQEKPRRRSHSKSPKHTQVLVPNTTGRIMFFSIALILLVCVTLCIVNMTQGGGGWQLKVAVGLLVVGALLTTFAATSANLFRFHRLVKDTAICLILTYFVELFGVLCVGSSNRCDGMANVEVRGRGKSYVGPHREHPRRPRPPPSRVPSLDPFKCINNQDIPPFCHQWEEAKVKFTLSEEGCQRGAFGI